MGAPRFSGAFAATLDSGPGATEQVTVSVSCGHPGRQSGTVCRMCAVVDADGRAIAESGVYQHRVDRYRYPMTRALSRLARALQPARERGRFPHGYRLVLSLAEHGWDGRRATTALGLSWDIGEALLLRALRQLHAWYAEAPTPGPGWIDKSEAQQRAESAAA